MVGLSKAQKNIILLGIAVTVFLLCFWIFIYSPQKNKLSLIKVELANIEAQIEQINKMAGDKDLAEAVKNFNAQLGDASAKFSFSQEDVIASLSKEAKDLNIDIESIKPVGSVPVKEVTAVNIEELSIAMQLSCGFKDVADYLKILRDNFPALVKINELDIKGSGEGKDMVGVNLQISVYLAKSN